MVEFSNFVVYLLTKSGSLSRRTIVDDEGHFSIIIINIIIIIFTSRSVKHQFITMVCFQFLGCSSESLH